MKIATQKEFSDAVAKAGWPAPRYISGKRYFSAYYSDRGTEVAEKHQDIKRGKVISETYMVNPAYLPSSNG